MRPRTPVAGARCPRALARDAASGAARGLSLAPLLAGNGEFMQVRAASPAPSESPLRSADHPATPWWSALLREEEGRGRQRSKEQESRAVGWGWLW